MITRLKVANCRSLADIDMRLGPLTVLVGANGTGKSNLIDVLRLVRDALVRGLNGALLDRHGIGGIRCRSSKAGDVRVHLRLDLPDCAGEYGLALAGTDAGGCRVTWERCAAETGSLTSGFEIRDGRWVTPPDGLAPDRPPSDTELTLPVAAHANPGGASARYASILLAGWDSTPSVPRACVRPRSPSIPIPWMRGDETWHPS